MVSFPRPVLPPVTRMTLPDRSGMSLSGEKDMVVFNLSFAVAKLVVLRVRCCENEQVAEMRFVVILPGQECRLFFLLCLFAFGKNS